LGLGRRRSGQVERGGWCWWLRRGKDAKVEEDKVEEGNREEVTL